jgi:hypothetical protein
MPTLGDIRSATTKILLPIALLVFVFAASGSAQTGIAVGQTLSGELTAFSGRSVRCSGCFADLYEFSVASTQTLLISVESDEIDTYLHVLDANGAILAEDDDGGDNTNSAILLVFAPGTYRIEVSTFGAGISGPYTRLQRLSRSAWGRR